MNVSMGLDLEQNTTYAANSTVASTFSSRIRRSAPELWVPYVMIGVSCMTFLAVHFWCYHKRNRERYLRKREEKRVKCGLFERRRITTLMLARYQSKLGGDSDPATGVPVSGYERWDDVFLIEEDGDVPRRDKTLPSNGGMVASYTPAYLPYPVASSAEAVIENGGSDVSRLRLPAPPDYDEYSFGSYRSNQASFRSRESNNSEATSTKKYGYMRKPALNMGRSSPRGGGSGPVKNNSGRSWFRRSHDGDLMEASPVPLDPLTATPTAFITKHRLTELKNAQAEREKNSAKEDARINRICLPIASNHSLLSSSSSSSNESPLPKRYDISSRFVEGTTADSVVAFLPSKGQNLTIDPDHIALESVCQKVQSTQSHNQVFSGNHVNRSGDPQVRDVDHDDDVDDTVDKSGQSEPHGRPHHTPADNSCKYTFLDNTDADNSPRLQATYRPPADLIDHVSTPSDKDHLTLQGGACLKGGSSTNSDSVNPNVPNSASIHPFGSHPGTDGISSSVPNNFPQSPYTDSGDVTCPVLGSSCVHPKPTTGPHADNVRAKTKSLRQNSVPPIAANVANPGVLHSTPGVLHSTPGVLHSTLAADTDRLGVSGYFPEDTNAAFPACRNPPDVGVNGDCGTATSDGVTSPTNPPLPKEHTCDVIPPSAFPVLNSPPPDTDSLPPYDPVPSKQFKTPPLRGLNTNLVFKKNKRKMT